MTSRTFVTNHLTLSLVPLLRTKVRGHPETLLVYNWKVSYFSYGDKSSSFPHFPHLPYCNKTGPPLWHRLSCLGNFGYSASCCFTINSISCYVLETLTRLPFPLLLYTNTRWWDTFKPYKLSKYTYFPQLSCNLVTLCQRDVAWATTYLLLLAHIKRPLLTVHFFSAVEVLHLE